MRQRLLRVSMRLQRQGLFLLQRLLLLRAWLRQLLGGLLMD